MKRKIFLICLFLSINFIQSNFGYGEMMQKKKVGGLVFFKTQQLDIIKTFYLEEIGCDLWLEQGDCLILKAGNLLFGFCQRDKTDLDTLITFFYETKKEVDQQYKKFKKVALGVPKENKKYKIYNFFAKDPDGRMIEFQKFLTPMKSI